MNYLKFKFFVTIFFVWIVLEIIPLPAPLTPPETSQVLYDKSGELLAISISKDEKYRLTLPLAEISPEITKATLLYEDKYFYWHYGFNPFSLVRSVLSSIIHSDRPVGGSTLTMQLARLRFGLKTRSIFGKLQQIFWAVVLERQYTKKEILEAYLNVAPYGANIEGIPAAALAYFHKRAKDLTLSEAVTLAVLPQNPSKRWQKTAQHNLDKARAELMRRFRKNDHDLKVIPKNFLYSVSDIPLKAPHFFERVKELKPNLSEYFSSLDINLQKETEGVLEASLASLKDLGIKNGAILLAEISPENSKLFIRAYVGSAGFLREDISGFVNGLNAPRSPGSLLKPFIYGLAIDKGLIIPETMLVDAPIKISAYRPENFERNFLGPVSATQALVKSRNIPALELFRELKKNSFFDFLKAGGVQRLKDEDYYGIALVLGGLGVTPEEIVSLYGLLAGNGKLLELEFLPEKKQPANKENLALLSPEAAFLVKDILSQNPPALNKFNQAIPWKTGTSYGAKDAWAVGIIENYVALVWLGNFDGSPNANLVGRDVAGPVLFALADRLLAKSVHKQDPSPKLNLKKLEVCAVSGALPNENCPARKSTWFIPGVSPIKTCSIHQKISIDADTGFRICANQKLSPSQARSEKIYEVWDSNLLRLFEQTGLKRNIPPAYAPECEMENSAVHDPIRIISPEAHLEYYLEQNKELQIELLAAASGDARKLSWFVDDYLLGETEPTKAIYWKAKAGSFDVRVVDDRGRVGVVRVKVVPGVG